MVIVFSFLDKSLDRKINNTLLMKKVRLFIMKAYTVPKIVIINPPIELKSASLP